MTSSLGSPFWQMVLLWGACLFLLWESWRGWRAGLIRSGMHVVALIMASLVGMVVAQTVAAPLGGMGEISGMVSGLAMGAAAGVGTFIVIWIISSLLFKNTSQQSSGMFRFFWGLGGAFFGFLTGLLIVWGAVTLIRGAGAMAEARIQASSANRVSTEKPPEVLTNIVKLKDSLELGSVGQFAEAVDPVSPESYTLMQELVAVSTDQKVMLRFIEYPGVQELFQTPKMAKFLADPAAQRAAQDGNNLAIMTNPAFLDAVKDPAFLEQFKKIDLQAALKFALEKNTPSPSPSPLPLPKKK